MVNYLSTADGDWLVSLLHIFGHWIIMHNLVANNAQMTEFNNLFLMQTQWNDNMI